MPRSLELTGVTIGLRVGLIPQVGQDGIVIRDALGQPKTTEQVAVFATDVKTGDTTVVPMTDAMFAEFAQIVCKRVADQSQAGDGRNDGLRRQLVETLTGGVTVPEKLIELPGGVRG